MNTTDAIKCTKILNTYGPDKQREMLIEECSELIQAVQKLKRATETADTEKEYKAIQNFIEEMCDVRIMLAQMYISLTPALKKDYDDMIGKKLDRQIERIEGEKAEYDKWRANIQV